MDAILLVLRTGMQWHALKATSLCHPSSAYRRFREWLEAGVFRELDGPPPTGLRYCINSVAMKHVPEGQPLPLVTK